jgi:zinc transport system ATP-binding protein
MALIEVNNITMGYEGVPVLKNLSFNVNEGDYICIVGENGSGKTTLMKGILGLNSPQSGNIKYNGLDKKEIGYLPQMKMMQKNFPASVKEVVLSGCISNKFRIFHTKEEKAIAYKNIERVNMMDFIKKSFGELSGGQQQRVLLARALCATEKLIVLDEPVTGLDPIATSDMYKLIKEINRNGITVIMVTHDINSAVRQASHILHISSNQNFFGTAHSYVHSDLGNKFLLTECPCDVCSHHSQGVTNV